MFWCHLCLVCSIQSGIGEWLISNGTCFSEPSASNLFMTKFHTLYCALVRELRVKKISGLRHQLNYCGLRPRVFHPCSKHNCTLNRPLGTLQPSRAPLIVSVVSVAVLYSVRIYRGAACECRKFPVFPSPSP